MKKYIVCASALLLIAGMANAQLAQQPAKSNTHQTATARKSAATNATPMHTVTPASSKQTSGAAIHRKHHPKKSSPKKTKGK
jgi:hypothetical protein